MLSPDQRHVLFLERPGLRSIAELAESELRHAGFRINPQNSGPSRSTSYVGLTMGTLDGTSRQELAGLPPDPRIDHVRWAPDSLHFAFTITRPDRIDLYVADVETAQARRIFDAAVYNVYYGTPYDWIPDSRTLIVRTVPPDRGPAPEADPVPVGPVVQEDSGAEAPARMLGTDPITLLTRRESPSEPPIISFATSNLERRGRSPNSPIRIRNWQTLEPNDSFVEQLVMNARAAIDMGAERGIVDPKRVAIGGHSYGAFMAANLLAHSDLFRAGIARSGAYNRTLTPFGFQAEERLFWEAPEVYFATSPFMHADDIDEPLLLIHGAVDNNSGTYPMQSERLYSALKGLRKTVRLVMLPHESHGYRARESVLHMLWETNRWLDTYVRSAPTLSSETETGG